MKMIHLTLLMMPFLGLHGSSSHILQRQKRNWIIDTFTLEEEHKGPFPFSLGKLSVENKFRYYKLHGQGVDENPKNIFGINHETGEILVYGSVDYEQFKTLKLTFQAFDKHKHLIDTQLGVEVVILDINDNPPRFDREKYEISVQESTTQGTSLVTVKAQDSDTLEANRQFDLRILSVTPKPSDLEFDLIEGSGTGTITFKGCLDHEKAEKYTIIVEAKDNGEKIQLSSTCAVIVTIEDGNNHLPVFTGQTGPGKVKEGEENVLVLRLQVTDDDTKGTAAWRAKYKIHGDTNKNFRITTDPKTNEGLLFVEKHLDYEMDFVKNLTISVENEIPYHSCKVQRRNTKGVWDVVKIEGDPRTGQASPLIAHHVTVMVEDVNEPPIFTHSVKDVVVMENVAVGHYLETFTARDFDGTSGNNFVYMRGEDPGDWISVDSKTGNVTTTKILDRESPFVKNNIYNVTLYAVDNGVPPMTGTATLNIHLKDENDNTPSLTVYNMDLCQSAGSSLANITAFDLDEDPYSGPFQFKLHGDVKGKWSVAPNRGYSVRLVKENTVYTGHHELLLEVSDLQGHSAVHNLLVTVCDCLDKRKPNCRNRKATGSSMGGGAFGIIFVAALLLTGILLLAFLLSCKKRSRDFPDECSGEHLMIFNTETNGTDCKVVLDPLNPGNSKNGQTISRVSTINMKPPIYKSSSMRLSKSQSFSMKQDWNQGTAGHQYRNSAKIWEDSAWQQNSGVTHGILLSVLDEMKSTLEAPGEELGDYTPHLYADEGDTRTSAELDAISIPDIPFDPELDLDIKFKTLASICMADPNTT